MIFLKKVLTIEGNWWNIHKCVDPIARGFTNKQIIRANAKIMTSKENWSQSSQSWIFIPNCNDIDIMKICNRYLCLFIQ